MSWRDTCKRRWKMATSVLLGMVSGIYFWGVFSSQPDVPVTSTLSLVPVSAQEYRPAQDFTTEFTVSSNTYSITISSNFVTDGASIPSVLVPLLGVSPWSGIIIRAALVHDALYATEYLPRSKADDALLEISREDGMVEKKALAVHRAVSDCGSEVWAKHTSNSIAVARQHVVLRLISH